MLAHLRLRHEAVQRLIVLSTVAELAIIVALPQFSLVATLTGGVINILWAYERA